MNDTADLKTHIQDIVNHIEMEDLRNIDLVGWSYGGMVTTGVLARVTDRIRSMIYDAFVPENGKALIDYAEGPVVKIFNDAKNKDQPLPSGNSAGGLRRQGSQDHRIRQTAAGAPALADLVSARRGAEDATEYSLYLCALPWICEFAIRLFPRQAES